MNCAPDITLGNARDQESILPRQMRARSNRVVGNIDIVERDDKGRMGAEESERRRIGTEEKGARRRGSESKKAMVRKGRLAMI